MKKNHRRINSIIASLLVFTVISTCSSSTIIAKAEDTSARGIFTTEEKQGVILHAWNWSFNTIKNNLDSIKAAGYTDVQVSPIQTNKDKNGNYKTSDKWWILYQPSGFTIGNKQLGTEEEFKELCAAAKQKGIKIIVDTIVNHTGNRTGKDGQKDNSNLPCEEVDPALSITEHPEFWHLDKEGKLHEITNYNDRYDVTHNGVSLPDLNTSNKELQKMIKAFLQRCLDDGAEGFRFDTAKHVELPEEPDDTADKKISSDFWPSVLTELRTRDGHKPYIYGEVLQGGKDNLKGYAKYFNVTASNYGSDIRSTVGIGKDAGTNLDSNFEKIKNYDVPDGITNSQVVTWVESHDTYANDNGESISMTDEQIKNGWAIVASRADSTPLYFNRTPGRKRLQGNIGDMGNDNWEDPDIVAINKFHKSMDGQNERLTELSKNVIMIERGTDSNSDNKGVVFVNLGNESYELKNQKINLSNNAANEVYKNCATTGGQFTVSNGEISGTLLKGITVLYKGGTAEEKSTTPKVSISKENCSFYDTLDLTLNVDENVKTTEYSIDGVNKGAFTNGQVITIGKDVDARKTITVTVKAIGLNGKTASETYTYIKKDKNAKAVVYFTKPAGWKEPYAYIYNDLGEELGAWPGVKMTKIGENLYKYEINGFTDCKVMFNDWFYGNNKTSELEIANTGMMIYNADGKWKSTEKLSEDPNVKGDVEEKGTAKVYFQKPDTNEWKNYDDVCIYFYGKGGPSWPGVAMDKVEGGKNLYTYTLPSGLEGSSVLFNANKGTVQIPGHNQAGLFAAANSTMIYDGTWREYTKGTSKVYFRKPKDWAEPNAYAWNGDKKNAEWPGVKMQKVEGTKTLYSYTLPEGFGEASVIFNDKIKDNDAGNQSANIKLPFEKSMYYDNDKKVLRDFTSDDLAEPEQESDSSEKTGVTKVYFKNTFGWEKVKVYAYNDGTADKVKDWPGENVKDEGNGLYSYTLPKGFEGATIIFNNGAGGAGNQTVNLQTKVGSTMLFSSTGKDGEGKINGKLVSKSKVYFKNTEGFEKVKVHYWIEGGKSTVWPGESMVNEGDNLYSYTLPEGYENVNVIFDNNSKGMQTKSIKIKDGQTLIFVPDGKGEDNNRDGEWREFTAKDVPGSNIKPDPATKPDDKKEIGSTVYVKVPEGWSGIPNIHYWNTAGATTKWPGIKMTDEGKGVYSYGIPKSFGDVKIIINDGSERIADKNDKKEFDVKLGSSIKFEDGEWKAYEKPAQNPDEPKTSKTPTVSEKITTKTTNVKGTSGAEADIVLSVAEEITTSASVQVTTSAAVEVKSKTKFIKKEIGTAKADKDGNWFANILVQEEGTKIIVSAKEQEKLEARITVIVEKDNSSENDNNTNSNNNNSNDNNSNNNSNGNNNNNTDSTKTSHKSSNKSHHHNADTTLGTSNQITGVNGDIAKINLSNPEAIKDELSKVTAQNIQVNVASHPVVGKGVFEALANRPNSTLTLVQTNAAWIFNGAYMLTNKAADIDTTIKSTSQNALAINNLVNGKEVVTLAFSYKGELPGKAIINANVDAKYNGKTMYMYSFSAENNRLALVSSNVGVKDGTAAFEITKGSDYILSETPVQGAVKEGWNQNADGSWIFVENENNVTGWIIDGGSWYYLDLSGIMHTGWLYDNGTWYYLSPQGDMLSNTSVDGYNLGENGALVS